MKRKIGSSQCARVEVLESRQLLSAAPASLTPAIAASAAAVHSHPTVPSILGTFNGTYSGTNGATGNVIIAITSEAKTGRFTGTLTIVGTGTLGIAGSVTAKNRFTLHGAVRHFAITVSGSVSSDATTLAGRYNAVAKHGSSHGTFSASTT